MSEKRPLPKTLIDLAKKNPEKYEDGWSEKGDDGWTHHMKLKTGYSPSAISEQTTKGAAKAFRSASSAMEKKHEAAAAIADATHRKPHAVAGGGAVRRR